MNNRPIVLLVAGLLILGMGVYVMYSRSGNTGTPNLANTTEETLANCTQSLKIGKELDAKAVGEVAGFRAIEEPFNMSSISFVDADGNPKTLEDWNGQLVLFNLWATWCPPCLEEMPWFEELQTKKGGKNFQVLPVSIDAGDISKPRKFYEENNLRELPLMHDGSMEAFQSLKRKAIALGMPTTILVNPEGCALGVLNGPAHWASPDAINLIDAAIVAHSDS